MRTWRIIGTAFYWLSWPILMVLVPLTRRTRILVWNNDEVLLVQCWYGDGSYSLPGGGVKFRENIVEAAKRELQEETGIHSILPNKIALYRIRSHGILARTILFDINLQTKPKILPRRLEITGYLWLDKSRILKDIRVNPEARKLYLKYAKI